MELTSQLVVAVVVCLALHFLCTRGERVPATLGERENAVKYPAVNNMDEARASEIGDSDENAIVAALIAEARRKVEGGNATDALKAVLMAVARKRGGETALSMLDDAKAAADAAVSSSSSSARSPAHLVADDIAAEMASMNVTDDDVGGGGSAEPHRSILDAGGRNDIIVDAYNDGSSSLCPHCNGLYKRTRLRKHIDAWCPALVYDDDDDVGMDEST
jgi:hypothetical protein